MLKINFHFFALAALGEGLSGSDRIFIELARNWSETNPVNIYLWREGKTMCDRQKLSGKYLEFKEINLGAFCKLGFVVCYIARIIAGIILGLSLKLDNSSRTYVYSTNDFWMDLLPGFILKCRFPKIKWISSFYLTAPNPFKGFDETGRQKLQLPSVKLIIYWLQQIPTYWLTRWFADYVFVTSEPDKHRFPRQCSLGKVIVVRGGVRTDDIQKWQIKNQKLPKKYLAVFQGRFHPQKGVLELVEIWKKVTQQIPNAKLVMIGDGPLMTQVKQKIKKLNLEKNITLAGFSYDGDQKYRYFKQSRLVVHPAVYDSGGMAAAEAMAFQLPAIGFDLKAYESYYPQGMLKVESGNLDKFAKAIVNFSKNDTLYKQYQTEAYQLIKKQWDWKKRSSDVWEEII